MNRILTEKEVVFLQDLRELMNRHNCMLSAQDDRVCFDIDYSGDDELEPVILTEPYTASHDLDDFIKQNS